MRVVLAKRGTVTTVVIVVVARVARGRGVVGRVLQRGRAGYALRARGAASGAAPGRRVLAGRVGRVSPMPVEVLVRARVVDVVVQEPAQVVQWARVMRLGHLPRRGGHVRQV